MRVPTQKSFIEQQLPVFPESDNTHDKKAVTVYKDGSVVGHVPQELFCSLPDYPAHLPTQSCTYTTLTHIYVHIYSYMNQYSASPLFG